MSAPNRRKLHFESISEAVAEAERLVQADREGRLTRLGNWSVGQMLGHLATWADFALDGYPPEVRVPAPLRWMARLFRGYILRNGLTPGVRVGKIPGGTLGVEPLAAEEGLAQFCSAMKRLETTAPTVPNPFFGKMTHEQWIALNLRHAELHMSFLTPDSDAHATANPK